MLERMARGSIWRLMGRVALGEKMKEACQGRAFVVMIPCNRCGCAYIGWLRLLQMTFEDCMLTTLLSFGSHLLHQFKLRLRTQNSFTVATSSSILIQPQQDDRQRPVPHGLWHESCLRTLPASLSDHDVVTHPRFPLMSLITTPTKMMEFVGVCLHSLHTRLHRPGSYAFACRDDL